MIDISCYRKRSREDDQDGEFFPLSKRINNLHLSTDHFNGNNNFTAQQQHQRPESIDQYDPELRIDQNPHYYNSNKILYQLHFERNQRIGRLG